MKRLHLTDLGLLASLLVLVAPSVSARAQGAGGPIVGGSTDTPGPRARRPAPRPAAGTQAQYFFTGVGSGTIGAQGFGSAAFTILLTGDTGSICQCQAPGIYEVEGPASIDIQGIGSADFTIPTRVFSNLGNSAVGFSRALSISGVDLLDLAEPDFAGYTLDTSLGPVFEPDPFAVGQFQDVPTSLGELSFSSIEHATFEAIVGGGPTCFTLDFQTEDDLVTPLVNGQHVDTEFGTLAALTSSGPNAGLAIFDSTPLGPNDQSQDRDLLVGTGHILVLQTENYPPDGSDVFPRPNDDEDGGTMTFDFTSPVAVTSVRLIDVDSGDGTCAVSLTDGAGRQRTFTVPSNWTGDLLQGQPGQGTLDLTTLAPQPGFGSVATASESIDFDPSGVIRLAIGLDGSGGIDDVVVCSSTMARAAMSVRNGAALNSMALSGSSVPRLGQTWTASLDCSAYASGVAVLIARRMPDAGRITPFGELLVTGALLSRRSQPIAGTASQFTWNVPLDLSLAGLELHLQGVCQESAGSIGNKTREARGLLSNALDLTLGF